ncbi:MAG: O-antigen ligase family protein [Bacteroidaceae bacterium]|nr:O-antigen ligase family protein [Bacteroidaceae bacterium]
MIYYILFLSLLIEVGVAFINPKNAIGICLVIIFLLPYNLKFNLGINLNSFNLAVIIIIASLFKTALTQRCEYPMITKVILLYVTYVIITSFFCALGTITMGEYLQNMVLLLMEYGLLAYFMCWMKLNVKDIRRFNTILFLVSVIIIVYGFLNYAMKFNPYRAYISLITDAELDMSNDFMEEQRGFLDGRVSSVFSHPLQLGQWVVLVFAYSVYEFKERLHPILYYTFLISLFFIALLTGSRSSLFPLLITIIIYVIHHKPGKIARYAIGISLLMALSFSFLPSKVQSYFEATVFFWDDKVSSDANITGSSKEGRVGQFELAWASIDDNLLFGEGFNYNVKHREDLPEKLAGFESIFLSHLVDGGLIGLFIFIIFYFKLYKILKYRCHNRSDKARVDSLCLSFFICISLTGITYSFFCIYLVFYMITLYRVTINDKRILGGKNVTCVASEKL